MKPIAIFYHCLFFLNDPKDLLPNAVSIVADQMDRLFRSGLEREASEIIVGVNGGFESQYIAKLILPPKSRIVFHGLQSHAENLTIVELEKWLPAHPDWNVLYFHAKGCTHPVGSQYGDNISKPWREGMMADLVDNWRQCVADLENFDGACSHFMRHMADGTQHIAAGNFFWATSNFLRTLPTIYLRDRIKVSGIASAESRFEAEVWIGNGPKMPNMKEYRPTGGGGVP